MTEQEYREEVNKIVEQAITETEECSKKAGGTCPYKERTVEGSCSTAKHRYDCASNEACELASEHSWVKDVDKCFEMLKLSPRRDEIFKEGIIYIFDIAEETFAGVMRRMAEEVFWLDVSDTVQDRAPEEVKEAWRHAEEEKRQRKQNVLRV